MKDTERRKDFLHIWENYGRNLGEVGPGKLDPELVTTFEELAAEIREQGEDGTRELSFYYDLTIFVELQYPDGFSLWVGQAYYPEAFMARFQRAFVNCRGLWNQPGVVSAAILEEVLEYGVRSAILPRGVRKWYLDRAALRILVDLGSERVWIKTPTSTLVMGRGYQEIIDHTDFPWGYAE